MSYVGVNPVLSDILFLHTPQFYLSCDRYQLGVDRANQPPNCCLAFCWYRYKIPRCIARQLNSDDMIQRLRARRERGASNVSLQNLPSPSTNIAAPTTTTTTTTTTRGSANNSVPRRILRTDSPPTVENRLSTVVPARAPQPTPTVMPTQPQHTTLNQRRRYRRNHHLPANYIKRTAWNPREKAQFGAAVRIRTNEKAADVQR